MELLKYKMLLAKYYEGNTSLKEESELRSYLEIYSGTDVEFIEAKIQFHFLEASQEETVNIDFETIVNKKKPTNTRKLITIVSTLAACVIMGLLLVHLIDSRQEQVVYAYVNGQAITDKAEAIMYSRQALEKVSSNLNKGAHSLKYINKINKPVDLITTKTKNVKK